MKKRNIKNGMVLAIAILLGFCMLNGFIQLNNQAVSAATTYTVEYVIQNDWGTGANVNVTFKNNGTSAISGWTLAWQFSGNQKITNLWNGSFTQSGTSVSVSNMPYNATIPAGGSVSFGFGMTYSGTNSKPASFTLNGSTSTSPSPTATTTSATTPSPTVTTTSSSTPTPTGSSGNWESNVGTINLGTTITYTGNGVSTNGSTINITAGGDFTVKGSLTNGMIYVSTTENVRLRLSGVSITNSTGPAIYFASADTAYVTLTSGTNNTLTDGTTYTDEDAKGTIFSNDTLKIDGTGNLSVTGKYKHGIVSDDDVIIDNGNVTVTAVTDGIHANDNVTVNGGTLNVTATSDCIESEGDMIVTNGTLNFSAGSDGVQAALNLTVNGGKINITKSVEGLESKANLIINAGTIIIAASDDGLNAATGLTINGGTLTITANADAVDSNGTININGGYTVAYGGNQPEGSLDCDSKSFTIKGGTVIGMAGNTSSPTASTSTQCSVILSGASANQVVS
ncbi:MAG TPA: carbohydrate-binding domain-containing protein, partial [Bacillota bacterium]|nr:carbohydrate-binding domain-containing protein [Bacillota bacterium]